MRTEQHRFIQYTDGSEELYDHNNDLYEWTNIASRPESLAVIKHWGYRVREDLAFMKHINRFIRWAAFGCIAAPLCPVEVCAAEENAATPNIIFLLADDMGYGDLGCFGSPVIQSPNLDRLALQGVKLNQCYAASSNCSPSRTGMLTGRSPYRVGMYDFARFKPLHIPVEETTVAEQLKTAGYQTMFAGKWHCSGDFNSGKQPYPGDHGFDHWLANATNFGKDPETFLRNRSQIAS